MSRIVLTTSSSGLDLLDVKTSIRLIRLRIYVNNVEFIDGKNIDINRLRRLMHGGAIAPVYSRPAPTSEVIELFRQLKDEGYKDIFITCLSAKLSESYSFIKAAAESFKDDLNIYLYDTRILNFCEGALALEAEHLINKGIAMPDIAKRLDELRASHDMLFAIDNLAHLIKNKKLSATSGFFANLLNIKPILTVDTEGYLIPTKKVRKYEKALDYIVETYAERIQRADSFSYIHSSGNTELDNYFAARIKQRSNISHIPIIPLSAISVANHGPTGVALCTFTGQRPYVAAKFKKKG